jgi:hypothetical protein
MTTRVYTKVRHEGAVIHVAGRRWVIDCVDVPDPQPGCMVDAVAHLSLLEDHDG